MSRKRRPGMSKKLRFDVFKRDGFECQYCGAAPPTVTLHVDHICPVAEGGATVIDNLITACAPCNLGKGPRPLSVTPESLASKAAEAAEREEQLRAYQDLLRDRHARLEGETWEVAEILSPGCGERGFDRGDLRSIRQFIEKLGVFSVKDAAEIADDRMRYSESKRFRYFCGVCWNRIRELENARP